MRSPSPINPHRSARTRPGGFTLIELVLAISIMSIVLAGMVAAIFIAMRSVNPSGGTAEDIPTAHGVVEQIMSDLRLAVSLDEPPTSTSVAFTVPDRDGDHNPETIRYEWSGTPGTPGTLTREYNHSGSPVTIAQDVHHFNLDYLTRVATALPSDPADSGPAVLLVVDDTGALTAQEAARKTLMESWNHIVHLIAATESQAQFDAAIADVDAAYVSEEVDDNDLNNKLTDSTIGVVSERKGLDAELGFADDVMPKSRDQLDLIDTSHDITSDFSTGWLTFASSPQPVFFLKGNLASDLQVLGEMDKAPALSVLETGDQLVGGGTAAGRRVRLPWGQWDFDINALNDHGQIIMRKSIEWAADFVGGSGSSGNFGYETEFDTQVSNVRRKQIATQMTLGESGTATSISAYVNGSSSNVRLALYTDSGGEPDTLLVQSATVNHPDLSWLTLPVNPTSLAPGTYWLALSFKDNSQAYFQESGGETRYKNYWAEKNGYLASWGSSDDSYAIGISIYATYTPD